VRRLREARKDEIKIDSRYVEELKTDGGAGPIESDEDEY
jgi:hypothetical protein